MELKNTKIKDARVAVEIANTKLNTVMKLEVAKCKHKEIGECTSAGGPQPVRVCLACGLVEEGWGVGYQTLTSRPVIVTCDEVRALRTVYLDSDAKVRLLRKETSLKGLIHEKMKS